LAEHDGERVVDDEDRYEQRDAAEPQQDVADDVDFAGETFGGVPYDGVVIHDLKCW